VRRWTALPVLALTAACSPQTPAAPGASRARRALLEGVGYRRRGQDALAEESWRLCLSLAAPLGAEAQECRDDLARLASERAERAAAAAPPAARRARDASTAADAKK